ncbi:PEP-CTERM sorting domain-containing protein [Lusitaniella coriacea LEGE 07157]|uniref:PEP-CTERM sorting domain-containing protein n=2 Tax=Lusitaniella TaxID=1983104 RepID=A0A8J7B313_9CYAN|nr:PEP-CTERM sorting domain-containing protein [Lusitaniella coriacea LEGE 07157]
MPSMAGTISYSDTNVGGPTWQRPVGSGPNLSGIGSNVNYHLQSFFVDTTGSYDFFSSQSYDGYLHLYESSFDPLDQLTNLVVGDDDFTGGIGTSGFDDISLTAGLQYFLVTSAFANGRTGTFTNTITGEGDITLGDVTSVPEPASVLGLLAIGAMGAGSALKRNKKGDA